MPLILFNLPPVEVYPASMGFYGCRAAGSKTTGLFYLRSAQQEVDVSPAGISIEERNYKNSGLEEGGTFIGLRYSRKIDTHFHLGL